MIYMINQNRINHNSTDMYLKGGYKMKRSNIILIVLILFSSLGMTGCIGVNAEFRKLRNTVLSNAKVDLKKEVEFSVGPAGLLLANMFVRFADDEDGRNIGDLIGQISRVQIGVYENRDYRNSNLEFGFLKEIDERMNDEGWHYIVRAIDGNELAAVYIKEEEGDILREVFVVSQTDEIFVLANIYGDLNRLVEVALKQNGIKFELADR